MKCTAPRWIMDKKTAGSMKVPCGLCRACRLNFSSYWSQRLMHEKKFHDRATFITMTYDDEHLPKGENLSKRDVQLFLKRLRKKIFPRLTRYFIAGEYGDQNDRPHYHGVLFGVDKSEADMLREVWQNGFVYCGTVTEDSCTYVGKYIMKKLLGSSSINYDLSGVEPEFSLKSNRPGIGGKYAEKYLDEMSNRGFNYVKGNKAPLPRFYRSKILASDEGYVKLESRRLEHDHADRAERILKIKEVGYSKLDEIELSRRKGTDANIKAKLNLKRRPL